MSTPPPTDGMAPLVRLTRLRERYGALPRAKRELAIFGIALLFGLIAMPFLIWFAGNRVLGPYIHGQSPHAGPFALAADFLLGLLHGSAVFWIVALGPGYLSRAPSLRPVHPDGHAQHEQRRPVGGRPPGALAQVPVEAPGGSCRE
ncbi:MAG: hypothetical protein E6K51_03980 [Gammaproteobacteria bacterium]|nr:MAG: hypothetical protein E6K51_03980 [Gammaproteobacteria bacterium]